MLFAAHATGTFKQTLDKLKKFGLIILDHWGIAPFAERTQNDLFCEYGWRLRCDYSSPR
jgi:DNA replication protein DnaC